MKKKNDNWKSLFKSRGKSNNALNSAFRSKPKGNIKQHGRNESRGR